MQTSQEELRSANEELQSTNEELQSTNEELTTSKEEMQSMNEELQTVNAELQTKVDELSRASSDMDNLLNSTDIATLFLDNDLNVRRFTPQATKIIKLIPADLGRPITDLASELKYPELAADAREILRTLASAEKPVAARDDRWFTVRIMPYRTLDNRIDGVVITFADITVAKTLEAKLRGNQSVLEKHVAKRSTKLELARGAMLAETAVRNDARLVPGEPPDRVDFALPLLPKSANMSDNTAELRRRAETRWKERRVDNPPPGTDADAQRLLHELEVHQIELEMQNAELQRARVEVETALEKYTELYDFAPVGYCSIDRQGVIQEVNLTGATMLGMARSRMSSDACGVLRLRRAGRPSTRS